MIARWVGLALLPVALACGRKTETVPRDAEKPQGGAPDSSRIDSRSVIVFLGTSLTAGYGLGDPSLAFPALIQAKLDSAGRPYRVVNAGISGESSAGALDRIDWLLEREPVAVLVIETGANDGLRGQDPDSVRARIQKIIDRAKRSARPPRLIIAGMEAMPNLGEEYVRRFRAIYPSVARANGATLIPFLLEGVAGVDSLNQDDGIHPNLRGERIVAETVWKVIEVVTRPTRA
ncbi:MAG TPA: arylesterase [Gemmatimonadales bacterium]